MTADPNESRARLRRQLRALTSTGRYREARDSARAEVARIDAEAGAGLTLAAALVELGGLEDALGDNLAAEEAFVPRTPYADVPQLVLRVLTPEELFAEKARALLVRAKPRDLFDVHFLASRGVRCSRALLDRKMSVYGRRFTLRELDAGVRAAGRTWAQDLGALLGPVPPVSRVAADVRAVFRAILAAKRRP